MHVWIDGGMDVRMHGWADACLVSVAWCVLRIVCVCVCVCCVVVCALCCVFFVVKKKQ